MVILWAGSLFFQGLIYSQPASDLHWRAPAMAGALTLFVIVWCFLSYRMFDPATQTQLPLDTIFRFQPKQSKHFDKLWAVRKGQETLFEKQETGGKAGSAVYRDKLTKQPWTKADTTGITEAIIVEEDNQK